MKIWTGGATALLAAGVSLAAAAGASARPAADAQSRANIAVAQQIVAQYQRKPAFVAPGPAFDARKAMKGKKVMSIPIVSSIPITEVLEKTMATQAKRIGFTFTTWANQGQPSQWEQGISAAINQHYNVIDLLAINPALVAPQIADARRHGIKVIVSHFAGFGWKVPSTIDGSVRLPYYDVGRVLAAWAIAQTKGKTNAVAIVANDLASTADVVSGLRAVFKQACAGCKLRLVNVPTNMWATQVQTAAASALSRDAGVNYLIPIYDAMTQFAVPAVQVAGKAGKVGIDSFNGTPFALTYVRQGKIDMDLGENEDWIGMAMLDAAMRAASGMKVPANDYQAAPLYIFSKANVADAGNPPDPAKGYGTTYAAGFAKLWGLTG